MQREERATDLEELLRLAFRSMLTRVWTAMPAIVTKVNAADMTVSAVPTITGLMPNPDGTESDLAIKPIEDCPLVFPGGGGAFMEFPVVAGDEVLLVFAARSIDNWWGSSGVQKQSEPGRMHNLSDGFAIAGIRSKPRAKTLDANVVRIRNDANDAYIEFNPTAKTTRIVAPAGITLTGNVATSANLTVGNGASGTFTTPTGQTVEVQDGIVTNIF